MTGRYALGIDFGTESGRAVLVDCRDGSELAAAVYRYANGVIDERLPDSDVELEPEWALQDPGDYVRTLQHAVPEVLAGVSPDEVVGVGIDFTACTMLPTTADGTPLCELPELRSRPHDPHPLFRDFVRAALDRRLARLGNNDYAPPVAAGAPAEARRG